MDEVEEKVVKKITLTREKAGSILDVDPNAPSRHIKFAFKKTSYKIYPKNVDTNKEDLLMFELVSAAYKRLTSETSDDVYIEADYPFKLFRKAFKEKRVVTIQARNGTFIVLGDKDEGDVYSSEDDFDASQYSFVRSSRNQYSITAPNETMTKAEKNRLKKKRQKENKRHAKEDLKRQRDELKLERHKASNNHTQKVSNSENSTDKKEKPSENVVQSHAHTSSNGIQEVLNCKISHDKHGEQLDSVPSMLTSSNDTDTVSGREVLHSTQERQIQMSQQSDIADNAHCPNQSDMNNCPQNVPHDNLGQLEMINQSQTVDKAFCAGKVQSNIHIEEDSVLSTKRVEHPKMPKHSAHDPDRRTSNSHGRKVSKDKVSHNKQDEQLKMSKQFKNADNTVTHNPENPRSSQRDQRASVNEVSNDKQKASSKVLNRYENADNGYRPNMTGGHGTQNCVGPKSRSGFSENNSKIKDKTLRKSTAPNSRSHCPVTPHSSEVYSSKASHANQSKGVLSYRSNTVHNDMSNSYSSHDSAINPTHILKSSSRLSANDTSKNPDTMKDLSVNGEQKMAKKLGHNGKGDYSVVETVQNLSHRGKEDAERGNYIGAITSFTAAIDLDASNSLLHISRSYCYEKLSDLKNALLDADRAIKISPDWVQGHLRKGRVLAQMNRYSEAEKVYEHVIVLDKFNESVKKELHEVRVELLVSMGYSRQKSSLAVERYPDIYSALENLLAGNLTDLVTDDIYVSDDEEVVHIESASCIGVEVRELHKQYESPLVDSSYNCKGGVVDINGTAALSDDDPVTAESVSKIEDEVKYYSVWLGNVTRRVKVDMIRRYFGKFGPIRSIRMHYDGKYAFVNYENSESAPLVAQGNGCVDINGMKVRIALGPGYKRSNSNKAESK